MFILLVTYLSAINPCTCNDNCIANYIVITRNVLLLIL